MCNGRFRALPREIVCAQRLASFLLLLSSIFEPVVLSCRCRDLKPENLIMTSDDNNADLKIVDFGFAAFDSGGEAMLLLLLFLFLFRSAASLAEWRFNLHLHHVFLMLFLTMFVLLDDIVIV
jgi:serine/threonine protein kinase